MFLDFLKKYGRIKVCLVGGVFVAIPTALVSLILLSHFQGYIDLLGILLSLGLPMVATPIILMVLSKSILSLDQANTQLNKKNEELEKAINEIKTLKGLLPICSSCKKIRDDDGYWNKLETYFANTTELQFSHGLCDDCATALYGQHDWFDKSKQQT